MRDEVFLCSLDDIAEGQSKGFAVDGEEGQQTVFRVRRHERVFAYKNICPHTGVSLNWQADEFMDFDGLYIQCATHGARFEVETGLCVWGPCVNQSLLPVKIQVRDNGIYWLKQ